MIVWGISANSHDASLAVFNKDALGLKLEFASHSERFSGIKNDPHLHRSNSIFKDGLIEYAKSEYGPPSEVVWYEKPFKKTIRQLLAGQGWLAKENNIRNYLLDYGIDAPISYVDHHLSHASAGYYTSGFDSATVVVLDSIGEFETLTIWEGHGTQLKRVYSQKYPHSIGLWYSAITARIGLKANEDEYILMGMAAYGNPHRFYKAIANDFVARWPDMNDPGIRFKHNLHRGCLWWRPELQTEQDYYDIAAAVQKIYEDMFEYIVQYATQNDNPNLVLMGGCALNCSANSIAKKYYRNVWIMPNPGDAGSSVGAVLAHYQQPIDWQGPYLGFDIKGEYPVEKLIHELKTTGIVGVANGPAEFGPRALGNRSLLADPRGSDIKHRVNEIKQRQQFRPFAPAILEEHAGDYFDGCTGPYMQFTAHCKFPELYPAIVHHDGTSRVQTVGRKDNPGFRRLLEQWYATTGCPMLLNTSLNIKGQPMVNTWNDAQQFAKYYNVKVY
jgi:carbamoyltransferase